MAISFSQALSAQEASSAPGAGVAPRPLITQPVYETQMTVLKGNTHRLARPEFDLGTAPATLPMQRMLLVLKRSAEQESALRKLLDDQQDKASPSYHKWLTPEQFGQQFGPTDSDMQTITSWLQSHGFQVGTTKGRTVLEFSGSASQVKEAFHTTIHKYLVNGEQHWANANDPSIPTALTPAVAGVMTLHNFLKKPFVRFDVHPTPANFTSGKPPYVTFPAQNGVPITYTLGPQDYATIYNINPVYNTPPSNEGSGVIIGVIGRSEFYGLSDITDFRSDFGLPGNDPQVINNGADPGDLGGGEEAEATLDVTWSGAVAPEATIDFVVSASTNTADGVDLSEVYIIENNLADVMTESFGSCEYVSGDSQIAGTNSLAEQAAAQGITYFVSTGDSGAEGCDDPNSETVATGPISVNVLASTPFTTAVGGTMFNESGQDSKYWTNATPLSETAISYIPEDAWNESCESTGCNSISAGSGGVSAGNYQNTSIGGTTHGIPKPSWQSVAGLNIPNDGVRDVPDVALTAASHDPYLLCLEGSCDQGSIYFVWGTSAAAPSFAGIMALVDSQMATSPQGTRQGQANYILYKLAASQSANLPQCNGSNTSSLPASNCIFNDVTVGNNAVPGEIGYGSPTADYQAGAGYDMTTGLGSVNVANLVSAWDSVTFKPTTTTLSLGQTSNIPHGTAVSVSISVTSNAGTGTPSGDVSLLYLTNSGAGAVGDFALSQTTGTVASTTNQLPASGNGGPYVVWAHYAGDTNFAPSDSTRITVSVDSEPSSISLSGPYTLDQAGQWSVPFSTIAFGSPVFISATVVGNSGYGTPTGAVGFSTSSGSIPNASTSLLNSQGSASVQSNPLLVNVVNGPSIPFDAGQYSISANYVGDPSFQPSNSKQPVNFTIQPGFFPSVPSNQSQISISAPGSSGSMQMTVFSSSGFSGTIALACSGLPVGAACQFSPSTIKATGLYTTTISTITVTTTAARAQILEPPRHILFAQWMPMLGLFLSAVLFGVPKRRRARGVLLWFMLLMLFAIPGCGGGGGSSTPPPPVVSTPVGSYQITVNASSGSIFSSTGFALFVQ